MTKKFWSDFLLRGLLAASSGPVVMAIVYGILGVTGSVDSIATTEMCKQILTVTLLAMVAGGMTAIFQVEQLPLPIAILTHGGVLYGAYILVYLVNGWLQHQIIAICVFTGIFVICYAVIWGVIYLTTCRRTDQINRQLKKSV